MIISQGMAEADVQEAIQAATGFWLGNDVWQGWGGETDRLNEIATDLDLDLLAHGDAGGDARAKINAIIAAFNLPTGAEFYGDLLNERYFRTDAPACVCASTRYARNLAGVFQAFGTDALRLTDAGLYVPEPAGTNKCTNYNANPTDLTGVTKFGAAASVLTLVDDSAALAAAGYGNIGNGMVFDIDNTTGGSNAGFDIAGTMGNTNAHTVSAVIRVLNDHANNGIGTSAPITGPTLTVAEYGTYKRASYTVAAPAAGTNTFRVRVGAGGRIRVILNQLEEASAASSHIVVAGSTGTRAAEAVTLSAPSGVFDSHLLLDDETEEVIEGFENGDALPTTLPQGKNIVNYWGVAAE